MSTRFGRDCSTASHSLLSTAMTRMEQKLLQYLSFLKVCLCSEALHSGFDHLQCIKNVLTSASFSGLQFDCLQYPNVDGKDLGDLVTCVTTGDRG